MNEGLFFQVRQVYGKRAIYPANEPAQLIAQLAGKKTLDARDIAICQKLGFGFAIEGIRPDLDAIEVEKLAHLKSMRLAAEARAA